MTRVRFIEIEHFRGIQRLVWCPGSGVNCLIGPGDVGKSTVLDAIDLCLGARRTAVFADTDFHGLDTAHPIRISVTLGDLPEALRSLDDYGPYLRGFDGALGLLTDEPEHDSEVVLTLRLTVSDDLEPVWSLVSDRAEQQGLQRGLAWKHRSLIAPVRLGAFADYHLGWQRGSVLNRLGEERLDASQALIAAARQARTAFGEQAAAGLEATLATVAATGRELGVPVGEQPQALLDAHAVSFGTGSVVLHDTQGIPLRGLGTGSTRLLVAGLQRHAGVATGASILLGDELEHGLEPHRLIRFLHALGSKAEPAPLQAVLTTHSPVALRELRSDQLVIVRQHDGQHAARSAQGSDVVQGLLRSAPEAFLASKVIVCEGATEVGFVRGLDLHRGGQGLPPIAASSVAVIDGRGGKPTQVYERALALAALGYPVLLVRDDDVPAPQPTDGEFRAAGHSIVTWRDRRALEDELFASLHGNTCLKLVRLAHDLHGQVIESHVQSAHNGPITLAQLWEEGRDGLLSPATRTLLVKAARTGGWFKRVDYMEQAAQTVIGPDLAHADAAFQQQVEVIFAWAAHAS
jgi:putative ATP-dependent endonuclease of the OLD family